MIPIRNRLSRLFKQTQPTVRRRGSLRGVYCFYGLLAIAMLVRFFPFGIQYFPYADDYNAYGVLYYLRLGGESALSLYFRYGMHTARPLAGLVDAFLAGPLWNHLWIVVLVMVLLHAATLPLLEAVLKYCGLPWGRAASLVFAFYPLLAESTYWVNAAIRIVPGFFFLALSAYFFCRCLARIENGGAGYDWAVTVVTALLSLGFYEQTVAFGAVLYGLVIGRFRKGLTGKRKAYWAWPAVYVGILGAYYAVFLRMGRMAGRSELAEVSLAAQLKKVLLQIKDLLWDGQIYFLKSLVKLEFPRFFAQPADYTVPILLSLGLSVWLAAALVWGEDKQEENERAGSNRFNGIKITASTAVGMVIFFIAPFSPFFLLRDAHLSQRNIFFCVPVFAMVAQLIWNKAKNRRLVRFVFAVIAGGTIWVCILLNIAAVNAYRVNYQADRAIVNQILTLLHDGRMPEDYRKVWVFGARYQFETHGGINLQSSVLSDWALTGMVNTLAAEAYGERYTVIDGSYYMNPVAAGWRYDAVIDTETDLLLAVDNNDLRVRTVLLAEDNLFYADTGEALGYIEQDGGGWRFYFTMPL